MFLSIVSYKLTAANSVKVYIGCKYSFEITKAIERTGLEKRQQYNNKTKNNTCTKAFAQLKFYNYQDELRDCF